MKLQIWYNLHLAGIISWILDYYFNQDKLWWLYMPMMFLLTCFIFYYEYKIEKAGAELTK